MSTLRAVAAATILLLAACATAPSAPSLPANAAIDAEAQRLMARDRVQGMAIAVVDNGQIVHVAAAGSMDTTITDQARLWAGVLRGEGLSRASRAELVRGTFAIDNARQFPTLDPATDPRGPAINLSAALGFIAFDDPQAGPTWFKGGHNEWTGNMVMCQEARRRCVIFFGNDVRAELIYPELADFILGDSETPWWWGGWGLSAVN